eukprot:PhM_4_TR13677/c2_g2_i1/m.19452
MRDDLRREMESELARRTEDVEAAGRAALEARGAEAEKLKLQLEGMIERVKMSQEALAAREQKMRLRELELDAREKAVERDLHVERERRDHELVKTLDEQRVERSIAAEKLADAETRVSQLEGRVKAQEGAYEALLSKYRDLLLQDGLDDSDRSKGTKTTTEVIEVLRRDVAAAAKDREALRENVQELEAACTHYKTQLISVAGQYNDVVKRMHEMERERLDAQKEYLRRVQQHQQQDARRRKARSGDGDGGLPTFGTTTKGLQELISSVMAQEVDRLRTEGVRGPGGILDGINTGEDDDDENMWDSASALSAGRPSIVDNSCSSSTVSSYNMSYHHHRDNRADDEVGSILSSLTNVSSTSSSSSSSDKRSATATKTYHAKNVSELIAGVQRRMKRYDDILQSLPSHQPK